MNGADPAHQGFSIWKTRDDDDGAAVDFPVQFLLIGCLRRVFGLAGDPFRHPTEPDASNRLRQLNRQRQTYVNSEYVWEPLVLSVILVGCKDGGCRTADESSEVVYES